MNLTTRIAPRHVPRRARDLGPATLSPATQLIVAGVTLALALLVIVRPAAFGEGTVVTAYNASVLASTLAVAIGVWLLRPEPLWPWVCIALMIALWTVGDVVYGLLGTEPTLSVADAFYVLGYLIVIAGVARLVAAGTGQRNLDSLTDVSIILVAALYAAWELVVAAAWSHSEGSGVPELARYVLVSYPVLDVVLLVLVAGLLLGGQMRTTPSRVFLALGFAMVFVGDVAYTVLALADSYVGSTIVDASWPLGYALVALAALHPSVAERPAAAVPSRPADPVRVLASAVAVLAVPVVAVIAHELDDKLDAVPLLLASSVVVVVVSWRLHRVNRQAQRATAALEQSADYYRGLATNSSDAYVVLRGDGAVVDASPQLDKVIGWSREHSLGKPIATHVTELTHPDDAALARSFIQRALRGSETGPVTVELRLSRPDGTFAWIEAHATDLLDDPAVRGIVVNIHDIDVRKRAEAELMHRTFHDPLTRLANRALLRDRIDQALARSARHPGAVAVLLCGLDGFKNVNDSLGHDAGDELLRIVAARLSAAARPEDTVARLGGDQFAVVTEVGGEQPDGALTLADRLLQTLSDPIEISGTRLVTTASIGVALSSEPGTSGPARSAEDLLRCADRAMYSSKASGRNRSSIYDEAMSPDTTDQLTLRLELLHAIERREFVLHYQPVVELESQRLTGFEALIRWQHPTRGLVPPSDFIPAAEESGLILSIGRWALDQACAAATRWPAGDSGEPLTVAVNIAARQVESNQLITDVASALASSGLPPERLVLELTESTLVTDPDAVALRLADCRRIGARIAIDDFGTGYSSLTYLRRFPIDILKIDRSFVETIDEQGNVPAIVRGLIDLGRTLEIEMIAEGIERPEQRMALANEGCPLGQGYLFSRPVGEDEAMALAVAAARRPALSAIA